MHIIKFLLLFFFLSCGQEQNIKNIYINKTQKIKAQEDWTSEYKISYLWSKPKGPENHQSNWIVNNNVMLFTPKEIGEYSITVSIENSMGEILGTENFYYNVIEKNKSLKKSKPNKAKKTKKNEEKIKKKTNINQNYTLQVSSWEKLNNAEIEINKLKKMGFEAYIKKENINGSIWYRVKIGKNLSYSEVVKIKNDLKNFGIQDLWINKQD